MKFTLVLCLFLLCCSPLLVKGSSAFKVDQNSRKIVDEDGRTRIFHGVNAVEKLFPFYPVYDHYDFNFSLCDQDFKDLKSWGFNLIRLYVAWEGFEPEKGKFNTTYLEQIGNIVDLAATYGFSVLLDGHQDALSREFCGEGWPSWAVVKRNFPSPLKVEINYDKNGLPLIEDCLKTSFFNYYLTEDVGVNLLRMFTNEDGVADRFANAWGKIAKFFKDFPNVVGYDLLNEPFPADFFRDPFTILPTGFNDFEFLLHFYQNVSKSIREHDPNSIIFYEPSVVDLFKVGFDSLPDSSDKLLLNYHTYCLDANQNNGTLVHQACNLLFASKVSSFENFAEKKGWGTFVSEFGAMLESPEANEELELLLDLFDDHLVGWAYWQYKYYDDFTTTANPALSETFFYNNGSLQMTKIKALARPYGYAFCGEVKRNKFDPKTSALHIEYIAKEDCNGRETEIYLNELMYYEKGFNTFFIGACNGVCSLQKIEQSYYSVVLSAGWNYENTINLIITAH